MTIEQKAEKIGELLAVSPLTEGLKVAILDNLAEMSERTLDHLLTALTNEHQLIGNLALELERFITHQKEYWRDLEEKQKEAVDDVVAKHVRELEQEIAKSDLRGSLDKLTN
ncbi:MAG: hypothetical protein HYV76_02450 [Candidatus Vogelbacteria bacterium]|nr:hypothetical protein [Candidatus Vogelbacteria bacterium]